jgi:hypothetical protein
VRILKPERAARRTGNIVALFALLLQSLPVTDIAFCSNPYHTQYKRTFAYKEKP